MNSRNIAFSGVALLAGLMLHACQPYRNFTTYYNLFYNMERIMGEVEDELLYIREQKQGEPVYYIPNDDLDRRGTRYYDHLERRSMNNDEMRLNKVKLDSIILKGSKLLGYKSKSDYVDDAVFYIGKTYFYEREWYQSQKKCEELIANFPNSPWLADAHLLLSMDMMQQGNVNGAETMLSRTVDIAWGQKRRDVLIEAFRLNADLHLAEGDVEKAIKPYYRAMTLSSDNEELARWQYEIGMIHFRQNDFASAIRSFDSVDEFSPDVLVEFQTGMQRAASLRAVGEHDLAAEQLEDLRDNGNYENWYGMVEMEMLNLASARPGGEMAGDSLLTAVDSLSPGKGYSSYIIYERGVRAFHAGDYKTALSNFVNVQTSTAPFQRRAQRYGNLLTQYFAETGKALSISGGYPATTYPDSLRLPVADAYYNTARVFASLDIRDSLVHYYNKSAEWSPEGSQQAARVIYAWAMLAGQGGRTAESERLLDSLVNHPAYALTDYAADARQRLGYTEYIVVDPAKDLYLSGKSQIGASDYPRALSKFQQLVSAYPQSPYTAKGYYAMGLIYERYLNNLDSAYFYYSQIVIRFPESEESAEVGPLLDAVNMYRMRNPRELNSIDTSGNRNGGAGLDGETAEERSPRDELLPLDGSSQVKEGRPVDRAKLDPSAISAPPSTPELKDPRVPPPPKKE